MNFDMEHALRDLDEKTPAYLVDEIFAHGDLTMRKLALGALEDVEPEKRTVRVLAEMLRITP